MDLKPQTLLAAADVAGALLRAPGNRHRLLFRCHLVEGEKSVGQLAGFWGSVSRLKPRAQCADARAVADQSRSR